MEPVPADLESAGGATFMLDDFALKSPQDAVQWLLGQVADPPKTRGDEAPPALKFVSAFTRSSYKRKQAIIVQIVKGFAALPSSERVKITLITMRVMEAVSALQLKATQFEQVERSQPEQTSPVSKIPDLKQVIDLIKSGAVDVDTLADMLNAVPPEQRAPIIESVKAAAIEQGLSEADLAIVTQIAERPVQDVTVKVSQDPDVEAPHSWSKLALMLKIAEELPQVPAEERPHLAQAAKVAVLQAGVLRVAKSIIELITELRYKEEGYEQLDERKQLEGLLLKQVNPQKDDLTHFFIHRALAPGGYADQLLSFSGTMLFLYNYAWVLLALPLVELVLSLRNSHCPVPLWAWLRADALLWLITAGTGFRVYIEYCRVYSKYKEIEEDKLAKGTVTSDETERGAASSDLQVIRTLLDESAEWKMCIFAGLILLSLLAGWLAMVVASCEIFVCAFKSCGVLTVLVALIFDLLRVFSLLLVLSIVVKLYQEYRAIPSQESSLSSAAAAATEGYGSFDDPDKPAVPLFRGPTA